MERQLPGSILRELPPHLPALLDNETCVYCGTCLDGVPVTKEHVIGRRFIPKGKLDGQWNLIVRACERCNKLKADLEDDLSAISMHADVRGRHAEPDQVLIAEAARKAERSMSRRTGKAVKDSFETLTVRWPIAPGAELEYNAVGPPQANSDRVFELSRLQIMAIFYWLTYDYTIKRGRYWQGEFLPIVEAARSDWGNLVHRAFMEAVLNWEPRILAIGAGGFFKVAIRRHPSAVCWSWALEWNQNYRIVGFCGEQEPAEQLTSTFPKLEIITVAQRGPDWVGYRKEIPLAEEDDKLFHWKVEGNVSEA